MSIVCSIYGMREFGPLAHHDQLGVREAKTPAFHITLRTAGRLRAHHSILAARERSLMQAALNQRALYASVTEGWQSRGTEQSGDPRLRYDAAVTAAAIGSDSRKARYAGRSRIESRCARYLLRLFQSDYHFRRAGLNPPGDNSLIGGSGRQLLVLSKKQCEK
jgi:hypothetical protein